MTNSTEPDLELEFQNRLLAAVSEVSRNTRIGLAKIRKDIQSIGGLRAAKNQLTTRFDLRLWPPSDYFLTTRRIGRIDLSVEAIALEPKWSGLFTGEEIDQATSTLSEYGFDPELEALVAPSADSPVTIEREPSLAPIRLSEPQRGFFPDSLDSLMVLMGEYSECEITAETATALRNWTRPPAQPVVRRHLGECLKCRDLYPDVIASFERFDEVALSQLLVLLTNLQATMEMGDEQLERFMLTGPEDYESREGYEIDLDTQLSAGIRPICEWRATRLGCQVGRFMSAFAATFAEEGDLWLKWRNGEIQGSVARSVRTIGREYFVLALLARNLLRIRSWPAEDEGLLWMPGDEGLRSVSGVVQVDSSRDLEEWAELLGEPPQDLRLGWILYLAYCTAFQELREPVPRELVPGREPREQPDRMEGMLRSLQSSVERVLQRQAEDRERQDAIIGHLERMVLNMKTTDRYACEESLLARLPGIYEKLAPEARNLCLASEQVYRIPGLAAPGQFVHGFATAFELQLRHSVISGLFEHLKKQGIKKLSPLAEWKGVDQNKPLWLTSTRADKCTLGTMELILQHTHSSIEEFFIQFGLDRTAIQ